MDVARQGAAQPHRRAILVISSNQWTAQLVRTVLAGQGPHDLILASGPDAAAEKIGGPVELVIADTGPATVDGLAYVEAMRRHSDTRVAKTPVILLSPENVLEGELAERFLARCRDAGISGMVMKPIIPAKLLEQVSRALPQVQSGGPALEPDLGIFDNPLKRRSILVVSENKVLSQLLRTMLVDAGATNLAISDSLESAKGRTSGSCFDLVIADSGPASLDGLSLAEWIRGQSGAETPSVCPIVLLTSKPSADFVDRALRAKVTAVVAKPLTGRVFLNRVIKALSDCDDFGTVRAAERGVSSSPPSASVSPKDANRSSAFRDDFDVV